MLPLGQLGDTVHAPDAMPVCVGLKPGRHVAGGDDVVKQVASVPDPCNIAGDWHGVWLDIHWPVAWSNAVPCGHADCSQ